MLGVDTSDFGNVYFGFYFWTIFIDSLKTFFISAIIQLYADALHSSTVMEIEPGNGDHFLGV